MAGRGAAPKETHQRSRDTARRIDSKAIKIPDKPFDGDVPDLPDFDWAPATLRWWETWTHSPQAHMFTATDWMFLIETAFIANAFFSGNLAVASELRLRVAKFGATPEDRARLRLQFTPPDEDDEPRALASVRPLNGRQAHLMNLEDE
ncbi:phage terminase small subunit [Nonomuraea recticatena]|uniref:Terminase small subunit n=1 Tax=Nonomuraea recticatena TaxID=46178 RepID=A0ABP6EDS4_9ACTN